MPKATPIDVGAAFESLEFLADRTPESSGAGPERFAARLVDYRNGGVFVAHFAGRSEWERHPGGDEIVMVVEGETKVFLARDGREQAESLAEGQIIVIPENTWHRFETAGVKIMTVTPRPTDHQTELPA